MTRMRVHRRAAVVAVVAAAAVAVTGGMTSVALAVENGFDPAGSLESLVVIVVFVVVGVVVASARAENAIGWILLGAAVGWGGGNALVDLGSAGLALHPDSAPAAGWLAVLGASVRDLGWWGFVIGLPMLFPDGAWRDPRRRWLVRGWLVVQVCAVADTLTAYDANLTSMPPGWRSPTGLPESWQWLNQLVSLGSFPLGVVLIGASLVQLVRRYRRSGPLGRQQLRLFAFAAMLPMVGTPLAVAGLAPSWIFVAVGLPLPVAVGFAVLARDVYDLRTATNRTLVWGTLAAAVAILYALALGIVDRLLGVNRDAWATWLAAGVVAVLVSPLRDVLQRGVNRLTYGRWDQPYDVLASAGQRLEATADARDLLADLVDDLRGLGLGGVGIDDAEGRTLAGEPASAVPGVGVASPLLAYGERVGTLRYAEPATPLRARDRRLLDDLAGHLGGVLNAERLTFDLQGARERLVLAREEERRRLRRDLHDGLGPALAGHLLRLEVVANRIGPASPATADVADLAQDMRTTMLDVRRLVEGLRPPALDELGLGGAVEQLVRRLGAGSPTQIAVDVPTLGPVPAAVEVAAYRIVAEAVTNVVRHADAHRCQVELEVVGGLLQVCVRDDGVGLPLGNPFAGNGLQTMRERAEELRGRLTVSSDAGTGTLVRAELPLPATARQHPPADAGHGLGGPGMTRVLVVDDHPVFRDGLAALLSSTPDLDVVATAADGEQAVARAMEGGLDIVLMDLNLPAMSGVEATARIAALPDPPAVLVVTMVDDDDTVVAAMRAGARGYVLKGSTGEAIAAAVRSIAAGGAVFGAGVAMQVLARTAGHSTAPARYGLTDREQDVLDLLAEGASNAHIARRLSVSHKTVQNYVSRILDKMQVADRTQAALRAREGRPG